MTTLKPTEWLDKVDSHGIYDAGMLTELEERYRNTVPVHSHAETVQAIDNRGLGGELAPPTEGMSLFYGYEAARSLALACTGSAPGDAFMGRGFAFRANVAALKDAGY